MARPLLDVAAACQNDDPWSDAALWAFMCDDVQIGFVLPVVIDALRRGLREHAWPLHLGPQQLSFDARCTGREARTQVMNDIAQWLRTQPEFADPLDGWRNEQYAVYVPGRPRAQIAFTMERAACALFGFATFGVHLTAYVPDGRIWVPKRAATKSTWPGYYDNSVAGGITAGDQPFESAVRECEEEAGLAPALVRAHLRSAGVITYFYKTTRGWRQPEMQYVYDLPLPSADIILAPSDGEAESFELMSVDQVLTLMRNGEVKPNCCLVLLDFFVRHGWLTPENEPDYTAIATLLHTPLRIPTP